jgi:hypothetical protein
MDLLAPFIPGYHWRFAELTEGYWSKIPGKVHGNSMYIGWSVVILVVYAFLNRKKIDYRDLGMWFLLALFFAAMALGPKLYIWGWEAPYFGDPDHRLIKMPYGFMQKFIPGLKVGARPNRLFIMAILAITMIAAHAYRQLRASGPKSRVFALALLPLLLVEYLPSPLPATDPQVPAYIAKLNEAEGEGALFDVITHKARVLFLQTLHERPIPRGWIARVGRSRMIQISEQTKLREEGRYAEIRDRHHYRFVLDEASRMDAILESCGGGVVLHKDSEFVLIDMQAANSGSDTAIREETVP